MVKNELNKKQAANKTNLSDTENEGMSQTSTSGPEYLPSIVVSTLNIASHKQHQSKMKCLNGKRAYCLDFPSLIISHLSLDWYEAQGRRRPAHEAAPSPTDDQVDEPGDSEKGDEGM